MHRLTQRLMQYATHRLRRHHGVTLSPPCVTLSPPCARELASSHRPSTTSFNPESYLRFPQFLYDVNNKLSHYRNTQEAVLTNGRLVYANKYVTVEKDAVVSGLNAEDAADLKKLSVGCKGLFWRSEIDYTCVPCVFSLNSDETADFSLETFLAKLGVNTDSFRHTVKSEPYHRGMLEELPIISYLGEDAMNVYKAPIDILSSILDQYNQVHHITVGEGLINPVMQFIVGEKNGKLIGFVSAAVVE